MLIKNDWKLDELNILYALPFLELISKAHLLHTQYHRPAEVQLCSLLSIKTGGCPEDCKYCPQSSRYQTSVELRLHPRKIHLRHRKQPMQKMAKCRHPKYTSASLTSS